MHKGRPYPFMPLFWVPEGYFWPYYCPWKWRISTIEFYGPGIGAFVHAPFPLVTNAAEVVGAHQAIWRIPITWPSVADLFTMRVFDDVHLMQKTVVWSFQLWSGPTQIDYGFTSTPSPAAGVPLFFDLFFGNDPYTPTADNGDMVVGPANYKEGGSPWL